MKRLVIALAVVALATTVTPALAKSKGTGPGTGVSTSVSGNHNTNVNRNTNININTNTATATATANVKIKINLPSGDSGGGAGSTAGVPATVITSGFSPFVGAAPSTGGGGCCAPDTATPATTGIIGNSLDLAHAYQRSMGTPNKWDFDLVGKDEIGNAMFVKVSQAGDGEMSVTTTDGRGITWDRFEMYGGPDKDHPLVIKKVGDNQWEWSGYRNGTPGVRMTGDLYRTGTGNDTRWLYVEVQDIGGGSREFTRATLKDRAPAK